MNDLHAFAIVVVVAATYALKFGLLLFCATHNTDAKA